ncbi:hypothetical protein GCM10023189_08880 [Nibrella saemangeumensis]|uniref:Lipocalin-like domain-containing protein n=1 Tax=Nibrella saemangeumensis TaxID=1084526 RepID=A0ABP8MHB1_9BACT
MKKVTYWLILFCVTITLANCKKTTEPAASGDRAEVIMSTGWKLDRVTDANRQTINQSQLNLATMALYGMEIQFRANNMTRAVDRVTKQVLNGGTWYLVENNQAVDIEINQFKGRFPIVELSRSKLILRNKVPVAGTETDANLEFVPSL